MTARVRAPTNSPKLDPPRNTNVSWGYYKTFLVKTGKKKFSFILCKTYGKVNTGIKKQYLGLGKIILSVVQIPVKYPAIANQKLLQKWPTDWIQFLFFYGSKFLSNYFISSLSSSGRKHTHMAAKVKKIGMWIMAKTGPKFLKNQTAAKAPRTPADS